MQTLTGSGSVGTSPASDVRGAAADITDPSDAGATKFFSTHPGTEERLGDETEVAGQTAARQAASAVTRHGSMAGARGRRLAMAVVASVAAVLLDAAAARGGWVIDQVVRGGDKETSRHRIFMQGNRLKVVMGDGMRERQATLLDLDRQTIVQIDYPGRVYTPATAAEYASLVGRGWRAKPGPAKPAAPSLSKDREERLRALPPDQRRALEAMVKPAREPAPPPTPEDCARDGVDARTTGRRITVAGYEASGYLLTSHGKPHSEVYIAPAITAAREIDPDKLERIVGEVLKAMPECPPRGRMIGADPMWKLIKDGYPVRILTMQGGRLIEVVKAEARLLGADEFEPPAGFTRTTPQEMMGGK